MYRSLILAIALIGSAAQAHQPAVPKIDRVKIEKGQLHISISYTAASYREAEALRERFDRDGDLKLSRGEQDALMLFLAERLIASLSLEMNGRRLKLNVKGMKASGLNKPLPSGYPFSIRLDFAPLPLSDQDIELRIADRPPEQMAVWCEVWFDESVGAVSLSRGGRLLDRNGMLSGDELPISIRLDREGALVLRARRR